MALAAKRSRRNSAGAAVVTLLLFTAGAPQPADAFLLNFLANKAGNAVLMYFFGTTLQFQPLAINLMNKVATRRADRGDKDGAKRMREFKKWFDYLGWRKGLGALGAQIYGARGELHDAWSLVYDATNKWQHHARKDGMTKAWEDQSRDLLPVVKQVCTKLIKSTHHGPISDFFSDVLVELKDMHLAPDIIASVLPAKQQRQHMVDSVKWFVDGLSDGLSKVLHSMDGKSADKQRGGSKRRRDSRDSTSERSSEL